MLVGDELGRLSRQVLLKFEMRAGTFIAQDTPVTCGVQLHGASAVFVEFLLMIEFYIRSYLFLASHLLDQGKDLPAWAMTMLAGSQFVRFEWYACLMHEFPLI